MNDLKCVLLLKERKHLIRIGDAEHTYKTIYFILMSRVHFKKLVDN